MRELDIRVSQSDSACMVELRGDVDMAVAPQLKSKLHLAVERCLDLYVDMRYVDFMGSTGVAILLDIAVQLKKLGRSLQIVGASRAVSKVFALLHSGYLLPQSSLATV